MSRQDAILCSQQFIAGPFRVGLAATSTIKWSGLRIVSAMFANNGAAVNIVLDQTSASQV